MIIWGINDSSHDASLSVIRHGEILFAGHSERYDKNKNTYRISSDLIDEAMSYGSPELIGYFERRWQKKLRTWAFGGVNGDYQNLYLKHFPSLKNVPEVQVPHHKSHACAGYLTSPFTDATIVVVDAIGEFECTTIWDGNKGNLKKIASFKYPLSFGLFYSAFTKLLGLKPGTEEYILMGMAAFGDSEKYRNQVNSYFPRFDYQPESMHRGVLDWSVPIDDEQTRFDIAASVQDVYVARLLELMRAARRRGRSRNLVFMGGCALNCSANTRLIDMWDDIWIMPNPGDSGSSLGAASALYGRPIDWTGPYLGHNISGNYPVEDILFHLSKSGIVAVANGRAEFGPRALGNRSILADPRSLGMKESVNSIKRREPFRPFAPVIRECDASEWFELEKPSPYMQFAVKCRRPHQIPAVVHEDGTSRVQTLSRSQHPGLYEVLTRWGEKTGVPVLLNTSLNIKNQPLLNDMHDVEVWRKLNETVALVC